METGQEKEVTVPNVVPGRDSTKIGKVASESCVSQVKESEEIRKETFKEAELKEATEVRRGTALK